MLYVTPKNMHIHLAGCSRIPTAVSKSYMQPQRAKPTWPVVVLRKVDTKD